MDRRIKIFSGNAHRALAEKIAERVGIPLSVATVGRHPDGEIYAMFEETVRGRDVFIVQPTGGGNPNENLMELLVMADAAKRASAREVAAVIPYMGYARQDRKDRSRVPISAKLVANLLTAAGVGRVVAMDLHSPQIQGFFDIPVDHLYASPVIVGHLDAALEAGAEHRVVVAPDPGSLKTAYAYSKRLGAGLALAGKQRTSDTEVEALELVGDVKGKDCVLTDDMTSTAGTLCAAAGLLAKAGAKSIRAAVSHCLLNEMGEKRLRESPIEELVTTDSLPQPERDLGKVRFTVLSIAGLLGDAIQRIYGNESVSKLFEIRPGRTT
ncbi:MAG: ribose-phosphate pyrophosphokinase [Kiritimatiellae bacterium]|nr:ribose-phosphate pyrophosphokinase [Kiritimatiellia bacterium]